ncbi:uncharacterized protein N7479_003413 [Penicillium vulpinum]|uniref:BZIP domain-containing protein n=1 Tax=Penicillium vulpinum TaxID=29845 RepID=A0A1V6RF95_9EURO|nr:uncharacterized protein N7479_003413 [Penicillium vulpinum]KAJ5963537.1 hypothetical protein N7479_003413 [Penicillium vulpinum]OQE00073.1 hypothetical protein PENVUL_c059G07131 [Penicillium vulpinum]
MEVKRKVTLEHRRAQNRLAQRRFRQRQSQKANANQPPKQTLEPPILATDDPSKIFNFSSGIRPTHPSPVKSPPFGFGVNCLQGGANGLIGIQNFINMDDLKESPLSSLISGPSPGISNTGSTEHTLYPSDRDSSPMHPGSLANTDGRSSSHRTTPDTSHTIFLPKPLTDEPTPASADSASAVLPKTTNNHNTDPGSLSALHIAAQKGHHRIMCVLLQQDIDCDEIDGDGLTPLIHATIGGHEDVVALLLMHGARIGKVDRQGRSVLHLAVSHRHEAILNILLDYCVGNHGLIDAYDCGGRTPLHIAVDTGFEAGVQALVQRGASLHCRTRKTVVQ